jgi:hypothetical protein
VRAFVYVMVGDIGSGPARLPYTVVLLCLAATFIKSILFWILVPCRGISRINCHLAAALPDVFLFFAVALRHAIQSNERAAMREPQHQCVSSHRGLERESYRQAAQAEAASAASATATLLSNPPCTN